MRVQRSTIVCCERPTVQAQRLGIQRSRDADTPVCQSIIQACCLMLSNVDYGMALVSTVVVSAVLMGGSGPFFSLGSICINAMPAGTVQKLRVKKLEDPREGLFVFPWPPFFQNVAITVGLRCGGSVYV